MSKSYFINWNLDALFEGGSNSTKLQHYLEQLSERIDHLKISLKNKDDLVIDILELQQIEMLLQELGSFIGCLVAQNTNDSKAVQLNDRYISLKGAIESLSDELNIQMAQLSDKEFKILIENENLVHIAFALNERRSWVKEKLPLAQELLINQLSIDGYHGWDTLYSTFMGQIRIPFAEDHTTQILSVEQASNKLAHPDRWIRANMFKVWEQTWASQEEQFTQILNHIGGFRVKLYEERGWHSILKEPLYMNRMSEETLNCMWDTIEQNKEMLLPYFSKKAELLDIPKVCWYDLEAQLPTKSVNFIPYDEAAQLIIKQFGSFSHSMGAFAKHAFENQWIEAEDRSGKMPGGFCSQHPQSQQSRIFMTYSGTQSNVFTLAHELGHAYHNFAMRHLPVLSQQYRMNVAETASTLAESILIDSMIKQTHDKGEKRILLESKLQRAVVFLMNIHARYLFETRFYEKRQKGLVIGQELNQMMEEAQKEAFLGALGEWHPRFWISKRHFYITEVPFYNFPYTFGYLFSLGIYAKSLESPHGFEERYNALLRDTGRMTVESLAMKHLDADLTKPHFWQNALNSVKKDVNAFVNL